VARELNVARLAELRGQRADPPTWTAIFLRAYGLVCRDVPELRRAFLCYPRPHLYEHPYSSAAVVIEREVAGEAALLAAKIRHPESQTLDFIHGYLRRLKIAPVQSISDFRQLVRFARVPGFCRRLVFNYTLHWSGKRRAKHFGTFMLSSYGSLGAEQIHPITALTTLFTFGPIAADGRVIGKIIYDHRVMDGRRVAHALGLLQRMLDEVIAQELTASSAVRAA